MKPNKLQPAYRHWALEIIVFLLSLLFIITGLYKVVNFKQFSQAMEHQPLGSSVEHILSVAIPAAELVVVPALLVPAARKWGLWGATVLMALFSGYVALVTFHFFDRIPCSCAGAIESLSWPQHLIFNLFFLSLSICGLLLERRIQRRASQFKELQMTP